MSIYTSYVNEFLMIAGALLIALVAPGPDFAMILKQSITYGKRSSIIASIGIGLGISVHIIYSVLGIGLIISQSIILFNIIKYLGAIYLIYIGFKSFKSKGLKLQKEEIIEHKQMSDKKSFFIGFLCNALNPKATLFFLSIFTVIVDIGTPIYIQSLYGLFCIIATMCWFVGVSIFLSQKRVREFFNSFAHIFDKTVGVVLIALGLNVALSK